MILLTLSIIGLVLSLMPAALFIANLRPYRRLPVVAVTASPPVSVLIPARNEEASIVGAVESALANYDLPHVARSDTSPSPGTPLGITYNSRASSWVSPTGAAPDFRRLTPSPGTPGEGRGEGAFPLPEYPEREQEQIPASFMGNDRGTSAEGETPLTATESHPPLEVIVLDDASTDSTAALVRDIARTDARVRLESAPPLPPGWCGKQHACFVLSGLARHDLLVWIDADVRLAPDALSRMSAFMQQHPAVGLLSGFPRQETGTFAERLLIPLIHFVLLGFLPLEMMRQSLNPAFGAGCGQLFMARRESYQRAGGHAAIRASLHDGITLPRAFRKAGIATDLFDATDLASCRMYRSGKETWLGLAKNATEGIAAPRAIVFWTLVLLGGQVMPLILLVAVAFHPRRPLPPLHIAATTSCIAAVVLSMCIRVESCVRFKQSWLSALLHPLGIIALLTIQWHALGRLLLGKPSTWKGRPYVIGGSESGGAT
jgi:hypothetical protein